jgi:hypothetical protein
MLPSKPLPSLLNVYPDTAQIFDRLRSVKTQYEAMKIARIRSYIGSFDPCPDRDFLLGFPDEHLVISYDWLANTLPAHGIFVQDRNEQSFLRTLKWMMVDCQGAHATEDPSEARLMEVYFGVFNNDQ